LLNLVEQVCLIGLSLRDILSYLVYYNNMQRVSISFWADNEYWTENQLKDITSSFKPYQIKLDRKAAIGAGASGLFPEFHLLLTVSVAIIANGFLSAVGEDAWNAIKNGIKRIRKTKPIKIPEGVPKEYRQIELDLIWWIQTEDANFMVFIKSDSSNEIELALNLLPQAIDDALGKNMDFSRLFWNGKSWDLY